MHSTSKGSNSAQLCISIIVWKWSINSAFRQLSSTRYMAVQIENCLKTTSVRDHLQFSTFLKSYKEHSFSNPLPPSQSIQLIHHGCMYTRTNTHTLYDLLFPLYCNQSSLYGKPGNKGFQGSHHMLPPIRHFADSKDEWNTKEDTDKFLKNALCILRYTKRHLSGWNNVKQWTIKSVPLAIVELY